MDIKELADIVERQRRIYGDALDRIIIELTKREIQDLADYVQAIKILYGMGDFKHDPLTLKKGNEFRVRPHLDEKSAELEIVSFLRRHKGRKFKHKEILLNISGRINESTWFHLKNQLVKESRIKEEGVGAGKQYWTE
jgi:hypothetical protein